MRLAAVLMAVLAAPASCAEIGFRTYEAPKTDSAIAVDGRFDEPIWQQARVTAPFVGVGDGEKGKLETTMRVVYDGESVYLAIRCQDPKPVKADYGPPERPSILADDTVEIFFDPMASRAHFYQFIINAAGKAVTCYDGDYERRYTCDAAAASGDGEWTLEARIPMGAFAAAPRIGDVWGMGVFRSRPRKGDDLSQQLAWQPTGGGYRVPGKFGYLFFSSFPGNPGVSPAIERTEATATALRQIADELAVKTRWSLDDLNFDARAERAAKISALLPLLSRTEADFLTYVRPAILDAQVLPWTVPAPEEIEKPISVSACRGEYEPASFCVFALKRLNGVNLETSDFVSADGSRLPASVVDPSAIKCWYQSGSPLTFRSRTTLMPELLLKNSNLISIDTAARKNKYNWTGEYPRDAETLRDLEIEPYESQQYWLTFHIPYSAKSGMYTGRVTVKAEGAKPVSIPVTLKVHDFDLAPPELLYSLYYTLRFDNCKTEQDYRDRIARMESEIRNQVEHGINCPSTYVNGGKLPWDPDPMAAVKAVAEMHRRCKVLGGPFICVTYGIGFQQGEEQLSKLRKNLTEFREYMEKLGRSPLYVQGIDEAKGETLRSERPSFAAAHEAGVRVFVACGPDYFDTIGDLLDMPVVSGTLNPHLAEKVHANGFKILSYANPQTGQENPRIYRANYGLRLWKAGYDGAMDWQYMAGRWDELAEDGRYREETMAYPALGRPVDTIQWEGWREGVDDVRYMRTLLDLIEQGERTPAVSAAAREMREWTRGINPDGDLDAIRAEIVDRITKLRSLILSK